MTLCEVARRPVSADVSAPGLIGYELSGLSINPGDDVAISGSLNHITGTRTDAKLVDLWFHELISKLRSHPLVSSAAANAPFGTVAVA